MRRPAAIALAVVLILTATSDATPPVQADMRPVTNADVVDALSTLHSDFNAFVTDQQRHSAEFSQGLSDIAAAMRDLSRSIDAREKAQADRERKGWPR